MTEPASQEKQATVSPESGVTNDSGRLIHRISDPRILFSAIALMLLSAIWLTTLLLGRVEETNARSAARDATLGLAGTYEAQLLRALGEIEQTLALVSFMVELEQPGAALDQLSLRGLLPPDILFPVTVHDAEGRALYSTRALSLAPTLDRETLDSLSAREAIHVGQARMDANREWWLDFSTGLRGSDGRNLGAVTVTAAAGYFVSAYETSQLGERGLLGLIGEDGIFRVRRSGDNIDYGMPGTLDDPRSEVNVVLHPEDGERRYTYVNRLFGFPLSFVLGLSVEEQHAETAANTRARLWRAGWASALVLLITGLLGGMAHKLRLSQARILEEQIAHAREVEHLAFHDGLTGLPNRSLFTSLLHQEIIHARRNHRRFSVMFLDIDKFKLINDTLGHDAGDELLRAVAERIRSALRESDVVSRLGGDEFTILLPDTSERGELEEVSKKILTAVRRPYELAGEQITITVSIGGSVYPGDGQDEETLLKAADLAMYHAKQEGRNNFKFYSPTLLGSE